MDIDRMFDDLAGDLAPRGASAGKIFGSRALLAPNGKALACVYKDAMAFKLGSGTAQHARALALEGAELFDPSGMNRPFKDWVRVPAEHHEHWDGLAEAALEFTAGHG